MIIYDVLWVCLNMGYGSNIAATVGNMGKLMVNSVAVARCDVCNLKNMIFLRGS